MLMLYVLISDGELVLISYEIEDESKVKKLGKADPSYRVELYSI